jgi:hypothetical protein
MWRMTNDDFTGTVHKYQEHILAKMLELLCCVHTFPNLFWLESLEGLTIPSYKLREM